jgi:hypothetical protein
MSWISPSGFGEDNGDDSSALELPMTFSLKNCAKRHFIRLFDVAKIKLGFWFV